MSSTAACRGVLRHVPLQAPFESIDHNHLQSLGFRLSGHGQKKLQLLLICENSTFKPTKYSEDHVPPT